MKRVFYVLLAISVLIVNCSPLSSIYVAQASQNDCVKNDKIKIGYLYSGMRNVRGFNKLSSAGIDNLRNKCLYQIDEKSFDLATASSDTMVNLVRNMAKNGDNPIIANSFIFEDAINVAAIEFPGIQFAIVNQFPQSNLPNVYSIGFKLDENSYLAGVLAALSTKTNKIALLGGVKSSIGAIALLNSDLESGFLAGANSINPNIQITIDYISTFPDISGIMDESKVWGKTSYLTQMGVDVIYATEINVSWAIVDYDDKYSNDLASSSKVSGIIPKVVSFEQDLNDIQSVGSRNLDIRKYLSGSVIDGLDVAIYDFVLKYAQNGILNENYELKNVSHGHKYGVSDNAIYLDPMLNYAPEILMQIQSAKNQILKSAADKVAADKAAADKVAADKAAADKAAEIDFLIIYLRIMLRSLAICFTHSNPSETH
jgi:basic membrane lipoprotein Med (substrate-binding protein (PBP1-ABC) superfamily)